MQKMIAARRFPYGLNHVEEGATFDAHDHDVALLKQVGHAKRAKGDRGVRGANYQTKVMTAQNEARSDPKPAVPAVEPAAEQLPEA